MLLENSTILKERNWLNKKEDLIKEIIITGQVLSDPTRVKILILLQKKGEICVTDIANIIGVSISAISHQLSQLEKLNLTRSVKMGKTVCYYPDKKITQILKQLTY